MYECVRVLNDECAVECVRLWFVCHNSNSNTDYISMTKLFSIFFAVNVNFLFFFLPWKKGRFLLRTSDMHHWSSVPALSRSYSVWLISFAIYKGEIECGGVGLGIYSFSKSRNRKISLPAAVKSPCNDSSRSRNRLMSLWHVWNLTENKMVSVKIQRRDSERVYKSEDLSIFSWTFRKHSTNRILTTFCRNRSSLSHFNLVTSCFKPSICIFASGGTIILLDATTPSKHNEHAFVVASADDIDSKPVSLST